MVIVDVAAVVRYGVESHEGESEDGAIVDIVAVGWVVTRLKLASHFWIGRMLQHYIYHP